MPLNKNSAAVIIIIIIIIMQTEICEEASGGGHFSVTGNKQRTSAQLRGVRSSGRQNVLRYCRKVCGSSVQNLLHAAMPASKILRRFILFWKICVP